MSMLLFAALLVSPAAFFDVRAAYVPSATAGQGEVSVTFRAKDPDVKINERPAPRLALEGGPLAVQPAPASKGGAKAADGPGGYLDTSLPVVFPVSTGNGAAQGSYVVKGGVTYFYCSKRDGWCRKGTAPVEFAATLK